MTQKKSAVKPAQKTSVNNFGKSIVPAPVKPVVKAVKVERPKSPDFARFITDKKTGFKILIMAGPENTHQAKKSECGVYITTIVENTVYEQRVGFGNIDFALEYIKDFGPVQIARFCQRATIQHAFNVKQAQQNKVIDHVIETVKNALM